jgi:hypothetical protein
MWVLDTAFARWKVALTTWSILLAAGFLGRGGVFFGFCPPAAQRRCCRYKH